MTRPNIEFKSWTTHQNDVEAEGLHITEGEGHEEVIICEQVYSTLHAQAIAAVPDLLQALEDCYNSMARLPDNAGAYRITCMEQAQAALTKAGYTFP